MPKPKKLPPFFIKDGSRTHVLPPFFTAGSRRSASVSTRLKTAYTPRTITCAAFRYSLLGTAVRCTARRGIHKEHPRASHPPAAFCLAALLATLSRHRLFVIVFIILSSNLFVNEILTGFHRPLDLLLNSFVYDQILSVCR